MKNQLPSAHQHGDAVNLNFYDAGKINNSKITKVSFDPSKIFYDVEVIVKPGMVTRIRMIDSSFVEKVVYQYACKCSVNHNFMVDNKYFAYEDLAMTQHGHQGGDYPLVTYVGYNYQHKVAIFESTYKLNKDVTHYVPVYIDDVTSNNTNQMVYNVTWIKDCVFQPDIFNEPMPLKPELTEYDRESIPQFSIKDIDKIFDDERRNHGSNPIDSINRMYRKLLALKEKGV